MNPNPVPGLYPWAACGQEHGQALCPMPAPPLRTIGQKS